MLLPHDEAGVGPALVLLHAGLADRTMWAEHVEPLVKHYDIVLEALPD